MKPLLLVGASLGLLASTAFAFWIDTPLDQLAAKSDMVVIGRVTSLRPDTNTLRVQVTLREVSVLKGPAAENETVSFDAPYTLNHCVRFEMNHDQARAYKGSYPNVILKPSSWRTGQVEIITLDSFATNEHCAVFLKQNLRGQTARQLVSDDDGKFVFDGTGQFLHKLKVTPANGIPFLDFLHVVQTSPATSPSPVQVVAWEPPVYGPFLSFTNLPATLILPRAITR